MTPRNPRRSTAPFHQHSWRQDILSYRRLRLQRSLSRLCTHPAVNPTGPHGPHGRLPSTRSAASSSITHATSHSSPTTHGLIPALFNDLVRRQLGINPSPDNSTASARLAEYLSAARAVTSPPSLSDSRFIKRITSGIDPCRLRDSKLLAPIASRPVDARPHSRRVRDIHIAINNARRRHASVSKQEKQPVCSHHSVHLRRSPRKRLRSQNENTPPSTEQPEKPHTNDTRGGELEAFRPSPDSVRRTRSEAARARRSTAKKTPSECCFCPDPQNFEGGEIESELIGPFVDRRGNAKLFVHFDCACWAPQVYTDPSNGQLRRVYDEYCRGRKLKCSSCGEKGATIGCYIQRCKKVFHYRCLKPAKAYCVERFFAAFCETHTHLGRKPSYNILMEAATIADVSAAQRREDTTYGLDAPHSRYTLLRRRETEIVFSRKWRIASHNGLFDTDKVVFSHRRKVILGKSDRISADDCVRVVKASALDIASGRLAFMTLAQRGEAADDVSAVEARAAIASRECTGLFLLRNLRNAPEWKTGDIEIVRNIPIESQQSQVAAENHQEGSATVTRTNEGYTNDTKGNDVMTRSGKKRSAADESENPSRCRDRKKQKVPADDNGYLIPKTSTSERPNKALLSAKLPSYSRNTTRDNNPKDDNIVIAVADINRVSHLQTQNEEDIALPSGSRLAFKNDASRAQIEDDHPTGTGHCTDLSPLVEQNGLPEVTCRAKSPQGLGTPLPDLAEGTTQQRIESQDLGGVAKVKSAWEAFLEEQLPRERLLRPDDSNADSLRNMARLWSLLTPTEREAYEGRGLVPGFPTRKRRRDSEVIASRMAEQLNRDAGLFSTSPRRGGTSQSISALLMKRNATDEDVRPSVSLKLGRSDGGDVRNGRVSVDQPNWDDFFPSHLDDGPSQPGGCGDIQQTRLERVRTPPARTKAKS